MNRLFLIALVIIVSISTPAVAEDVGGVLPQLLVESEVMLLAVSPLSSPFTQPLLESWIAASLAFTYAQETQYRSNLSEMITTYNLLEVDKSVRTTAALSDRALKKLKDDVTFYVDKYPRFKDSGYAPNRDDDPDAYRHFQHYQAIKKTYETQAEPLRAAAKDAIDAVDTLRVRSGTGKFYLSDLKKENGFLWGKMNALYKQLTYFEKNVTDLDDQGHSPKESLRVIIKNYAPNLVFFVQIAQPDGQGNFKVSDYTKYPIAVYPKNPPQDMQSVDPKGPRGPWRTWLPINTSDKIIIRVATMGPVRDRIRFLPIKGSDVRPHLDSLVRGYYYLAYETNVPERAAPLVSRWSPVNEQYSWKFDGEWEPLGDTANDPKIFSTPGKELRGFGPQLTLTNDKLEWILLSDKESLLGRGSGNATIKGKTQYEWYGPAAAKPTGKPEILDEEGEGVLRVEIEKW